MNFVGRADPLKRLTAWLSGDGVRMPLSIVSVSGPGGIGKTFLLEHAIRSSSMEGRNHLRLRIAGSREARTVAQAVCHDLLQSCSQLDPAGKDYFIETRRNLDALRLIDDQARREAEVGAGGDAVLRQAILDLFHMGAGVQAAIPALRRHIDLARVGDEHLDAVLRLLEKAKAYQQERRLLGGLLPDILQRGRRNRLRAGTEAAIADGLIADLSAILSEWRARDLAKPMPRKVRGLDRLLLVVDDFESLADLLTPFLAEHLVPLLARANFETLIVILGRDRLSDTHPVWRQRHEAHIVGELRLSPFTRDEAEAFIRSCGISNDATIARILDETAGYPYLLAGEVEAELGGGRTALALKTFYDRTTRWMTPGHKGWLEPLCFLDEINEETIATILPANDPKEVLEWFKSEASVRSPAADRWEVLPIIRSRICAYVKLDSPRRFRDLQGRAASAARLKDEAT